MPKSYRIRTQPGVDKNIRVEIAQDFDFLEILSLKLRQEDVYTRFCADYGVVVGRVITNGGYGVPNARVSVFVPLEEMDENDPIISTLYPYKNLGQKNEDGYRYNLLPYEQSYQGHTPTGTFPTEDDVLTRQEVLEIYEKYYKFTVKTNESGDFMIVGVPLGIQKVVMDLDLSDMGCFSLRPSDLIRMGMASPTQVAGQEFRASTDLSTLPQIINSVKDVDVASFWGQEDLCSIGITRVDFDLRDFGITIEPQAIFMGSMFSNPDEDGIKENCSIKNSTGRLCEMVASPGTILAIRQTIGVESDTGYPILEEYKLENGGNIIDSDGTWLVDLPMNLDYVVTNEFGEQVLSNDPSIGIPTKAKYRFKIKYQNEGGLENEFQRANYLVPNVREYVDSDNMDANSIDAQFSYAFSLDWDDYGNPGMIQDAINCEDRFYEFNYNKVYTVSSHIDRFKFGFGDKKHLGIKNIDESLCKTSTTKFPVNDGEQNSGNLFFFDLFMQIIKTVFFPLIIVMHILFLVYSIIAIIINPIIWLINLFRISNNKPKYEYISFPTLNLPMISYPDCEGCNCEQTYTSAPSTTSVTANTSQLANVNDRGLFNYSPTSDEDLNRQLKWAISGNESENIKRVPYFKDGSKWAFSAGPTLSQNLNLINQRGRYFNSDAFSYSNTGNNPSGTINMIRTTVRNNTPNGTPDYSNPLYDNVIILLCDPGTVSSYGVGSLLTFSSVDSLDDKNLTGGTLNQFNNTAVTGQTKFNSTDLVTTTIQNILPNGSVNNVDVKILSDDSNEGYFKFTTGVEYFQVITGETVGNIQNIIDNGGKGTNSIINQFVTNYRQPIAYRTSSVTNPIISNIKPLTLIDNYTQYEIMILVRGVDPHTKRQNIEYDLSPLFGLEFGKVTVEGSYKLNIPIQPNTGSGNWYNDYKTPESHNLSDNNNSVLFHPSFTFSANTSQFIPYRTKEFYRYSSMDKSKSTFQVGTASPPVQDYCDSNKGGIQSTVISGKYPRNQGLIEGASLIGMDISYNLLGNIKDVDGWLYSPVYYDGVVIYKTSINNAGNANLNSNGLLMSSPDKIVFRSDRLPTSDQTEKNLQSGFVLHQNQKFAIYGVDDEGNQSFTPNFPTQSNYKGTGSLDFTGSTSSGFANVMESLSCKGMVTLDAYEGVGTSFTVNESKNENYLNQKQVVNGCYRLIKTPVLTLGEDTELFFEWMARYRVMYAACQGAFAQMFQNNWVNGTLYMPTFNKGTIYNLGNNDVSHYTYCGNPENAYTNKDGKLSTGAGPIIFNSLSNNFYYKSTKYNQNTNSFIGQKEWTFPLVNFGYGAQNETNIWFPTTVMDLGPRDQFTKQICFDPSFEGYLVDTLRSTSYQDTSDLLNMFIISRLSSSGFWSQAFGLGDASINSYFSRSGDRIDSDVAQMWSINSEYGILPFLGTNYDDNKISVKEEILPGRIFNPKPIFGIFFTGNTESRKLLTPGKTEYTTFGYPKTQFVPLYRWQYETQNNLFGGDRNEWLTNGPITRRYQDLDFDNSEYFQFSNGENVGYIYNQGPQGNPLNKFPNNQDRYFIVGAPYHFYFGLRRGKTAMNRFITKYIL